MLRNIRSRKMQTKWTGIIGEAKHWKIVRNRENRNRVIRNILVAFSLVFTVLFLINYFFVGQL